MLAGYDSLVGYKFNPKYWYSQGSIVHFARQYWNQYGFWKIDKAIMVRVDMEGNEIIPIQTQKIPDHVYGWHLKHVVPVGFPTHPLLEDHNKRCLAAYLMEPDEKFIKRDRQIKEANELSAKLYQEWLATATPLMKKMRGFDWSFKMADQSYPEKYRIEDEIMAELETLPYEEALDLMNKYGGGNGDGSDKPDYRKCPGFKYPDVAVHRYSDREVVRTNSLDPQVRWALVVNQVEEIIYEGIRQRYKFETDHVQIAMDKLVKSKKINAETPVFTEGRQWSTIGELFIKDKEVA